MNKHYIRNLAEKSGIELISNGFNVYTEFASLSELEKFAEFIVKECADVAKETRWAVPPSQEQIARGIQQHFGVEE